MPDEQNKKTDQETPAVAESIRPGDNNNNKHNKTKEIGGPKGLEPTRYGDWEKAGRCIDF